jgi:hypothetical protein
MAATIQPLAVAAALPGLTQALGSMILANPRPLTEAEASTLSKAVLLAPTRRLTPEMIASIDALRVYEECDCGCATVWFMPDGALAGNIVAEAETQKDSEQIGVTVFAKNGALAGLEVTGDGKTPLPSPNAAWTAI